MPAITAAANGASARRYAWNQPVSVRLAIPRPCRNSIVVSPPNATNPQNTRACAVPATGRSRIVRRCSTTSTRNRLTRKPRSSTAKGSGAAAMRRSRRATCAANAPTPARNTIQNVRVCMLTTTDARGRSRLAERGRGVLRPNAPLRLFQGIDYRRNDLEQIADDAVVGDLEDGRVGIFVDGGDRLRAFHPDQVLN